MSSKKTLTMICDRCDTAVQVPQTLASAQTITPGGWQHISVFGMSYDLCSDCGKELRDDFIGKRT